MQRRAPGRRASRPARRRSAHSSGSGRSPLRSSATSRVRSMTSSPLAAPVTERAPHDARDAAFVEHAASPTVPSMRAKRFACVAAMTRPRSSCMRPSSMAPSSHSARASTCSSRLRCLRPASDAVARRGACGTSPSRTPVVAASRRPGRPGRGRHDARRPCVARRPVATLADAARQDELHDAAGLASRRSRCPLARRRDPAPGNPSARAPSTRRSKCQSRKRGRPPTIAIVSNSPSP